MSKLTVLDKDYNKGQRVVKSGDYQVAGRPLFIRLYSGLSVAALKAGLDKELALWYELRAINSSGSSNPSQQWSSGRLVLNDVVASLVKHFGYSQATVYRLLQAGDGKLWDIKDPPPIRVAAWATNAKHSYSDVPTVRSRQSGRGQDNYSTEISSSVIQIKGLLRVAEWFNTYTGWAVEVPARDFKGRRAKTAWLYASFFKADGSKAKPISRDSIKAATGVLRRQQQRYDKVAGIKRVANFAFQQDDKGKLTPMLHLVDGKSRQWLKNRRLGNTYHFRALKASRGMTKRVNAELRQRSFDWGEARLLKRFFLTARSLIRSSERDNEAFILVNKRDRLIKGRMEWCIA